MGMRVKVSDETGSEYNITVREDYDDSSFFIVLKFIAGLIALFMPFAAWYALVTTGGEFSFQILFSSVFLPVWMILALNVFFTFLLVRKALSLSIKITLDLLNIILSMSLLVAYIYFLPSVGDGIQIILVLSSLFFTIPLVIHASNKLIKFKELLLVYIVSNVISSVLFVNILDFVIWKEEFVFASNILVLGFVVFLLTILPGTILTFTIVSIRKRKESSGSKF